MSEQNLIVNSIGFWVAIGLAIGAGIGVALHNIPLGGGIGLVIGAAIGGIRKIKINKKP